MCSYPLAAFSYCPCRITFYSLSRSFLFGPLYRTDYGNSHITAFRNGLPCRITKTSISHRIAFSSIFMMKRNKMCEKNSNGKRVGRCLCSSLLERKNFRNMRLWKMFHGLLAKLLMEKYRQTCLKYYAIQADALLLIQS